MVKEALAFCSAIGNIPLQAVDFADYVAATADQVTVNF
jgi:hypothetical protein